MPRRGGGWQRVRHLVEPFEVLPVADGRRIRLEELGADRLDAALHVIEAPDHRDVRGEAPEARRTPRVARHDGRWHDGCRAKEVWH